MITVKQQQLFKNSRSIALIGNGGNLAIAQHMASDIYRHTGKFCFAPDSINLTALGGDRDWKEEWIEYARRGADLIIAITCRVYSPMVRVLEKTNIKVLLIAPNQHETLETIVLDTTHYHKFEISALSIIYDLIEGTGVELPTLPKVVQSYGDITEERDDIYCIDIDGTLTEQHEGTPWEAVPIPSRIERVNKLYDEGATIYLMTARGFIHSNKRYPEDIIASQREADYHCRARTENQLEKWGVKYHRLFFGKPRANYYIDDRSQTDSFLDQS